MKPKANHHKSSSNKKQSSNNNPSSNKAKGTAAAGTDLAVRRRSSLQNENDAEEAENPNSGFSEYLKSGTGTNKNKCVRK